MKEDKVHIYACYNVSCHDGYQREYAMLLDPSTYEFSNGDIPRCDRCKQPVKWLREGLPPPYIDQITLYNRPDGSVTATCGAWVIARKNPRGVVRLIDVDTPREMREAGLLKLIGRDRL